MTLIIDHTNLGRAVTGIERVAVELFDPASFAPELAHAVRARGLLSMIAKQQVSFLIRGLLDPSSKALFPGFPPSPLSCLLGRRCIAYIHDTFPLSRPQDLNWRARLYIAPSFHWAVRRLDHFFVASLTTGEDLRQFCRPDALIVPLRLGVRNVFGLTPRLAPTSSDAKRPLRLVALGTVEPRKNYAEAIAIAAALNRGGRPTELHIVGRVGWGQHDFLDQPPPFLKVHGYLDTDAVRDLIQSADGLISTSHAEGVGLPLLEVQHGAIPVIAPDDKVFHEVLGSSGVLIPRGHPDRAAHAIATAFGAFERRVWLRQAALDNVARWNALARKDRQLFTAFLEWGRPVYETRTDIKPAAQLKAIGSA